MPARRARIAESAAKSHEIFHLPDLWRFSWIAERGGPAAGITTGTVRSADIL
jgi:hypothetical protein